MELCIYFFFITLFSTIINALVPFFYQEVFLLETRLYSGEDVYSSKVFSNLTIKKEGEKRKISGFTEKQKELKEKICKEMKGESSGEDIIF